MHPHSTSQLLSPPEQMAGCAPPSAVVAGKQMLQLAQMAAGTSVAGKVAAAVLPAEAAAGFAKLKPPQLVKLAQFLSSPPGSKHKHANSSLKHHRVSNTLM